MAHVYCAGPLFNSAEQEEMTSIAAVLEEAGHTTFLPHRDGLEFAQLQPLLTKAGLSETQAAHLLQRAIFALDARLVLEEADAVVANLNGRVPDEGMIVEAALAWASGKALVFYKSDVRSLLHGTDNPLVLGLTQFETVASIAEIPAFLERKLHKPQQQFVKSTCAMGATISKLRQQHTDSFALVEALLKELH